MTRRRYGGAILIYVVSVMVAALVVALGWLSAELAMLSVLLVMVAICCLESGK